MTVSMSSFKNSGFFVLRTPLLPAGTFYDLCGPGPADAPDLGLGLAAAREHTRAVLRRLVGDPVVREALFLASPGLEAEIPSWLAAPLGERGQRIESSLVRYLSRMATRATPFGLCAGTAIGELRGQTDLALAPRARYRRYTRVDNEVLASVLDAINADPEFRRGATYFPNSSAYEVGARLRYVETQVDPEHRGRTYSLVAIELDRYVASVLERAREGATAAELVRALRAADRTISLADARGFVDALIENQVLVSPLAVAVTGDEPLADAVVELGRAGAARHAGSLQVVADQLRKVDAAGIGVPRASYAAIEALVRQLPAGSGDLGRLFQVNLTMPLERQAIGADVVLAVRGAAASLCRIAAAPTSPVFEKMRQRLERRHGGRPVPLTAFLDPETGVGADANAWASDTSPLLDGLELRRPEPRAELPTSRRDLHLLGRLRRVWRDGEHEVALDDDDLAALEVKDKPDLSSSMSASFRLGRSPAGGLQVLLDGVAGPPGVRLFGRFCHGDPRLTEHVREHLRAEEATRPQAVFAEIVHLPEGRLGNIACRPVLRDFEIVYLGKSGAPVDRRIPITDLWVHAEEGRIVLTSKRLGREVVPRLTNAHASGFNTVGAYSFLTALAYQSSLSWLGWRWGGLAGAVHLPRVRIGDVIVAREEWNISAAELRTAGAGPEPERWRRVQSLRQRYAMARWVTLTDADHELPLDLESPHGVDMLVTASGEPAVRLLELWPVRGAEPLDGPEGAHVVEVVMPLVRSVTRAETDPGSRLSRARALVEPLAVAPVRTAPRRERPRPWMSLAVQVGPSSIDEVVARDLLLHARRLTRGGQVDAWRFDRVPEPDWHIGLHVRPRTPGNTADVTALLSWAANHLLHRRRIDDWTLSPYEPDDSRLGGAEGLDTLALIDTHDSVAAAKLLGRVLPVGGEDVRWRLALASLDRLLDGLGLDLAAKEELIGTARAARAMAVRLDAKLERQLADRHRARAAEVNQILAGAPGDDRLALAAAPLSTRARALTPVPARLESLRSRDPKAAQKLELEAVGRCCNRLLRAASMAEELALLDLAARAYRTRLGRLKAEERQRATSVA